MNSGYRSVFAMLSAAVLTLLVLMADTFALGPPVSHDQNKHNLSSAVYDVVRTDNAFSPDTNSDRKAASVSINNPTTLKRASRDASIKYRATNAANNPSGRQICIFCHTPHTANVAEGAPLWNRAFSIQTFSRYSSATLQIRSIGAAQYGANKQPDGASKLCLSCHDGVTNLGTVRQSVQSAVIVMDTTNGGDVKITGPASFNPSTNKMKTGHHPVSFVYNGSIQGQISTGRLNAGLGGGLGFTVPADSSAVKRDKNNKMQCTTCHDPHQNQSDDNTCYWSSAPGYGLCSDASSTGRKVVPFWVYPGSDAFANHDTVCTSCHNLTKGNSPNTPWP